MSDMTDVLVKHQRQNASSCLCGWSELGKSHPAHQAAALSAAGFGPVQDAAAPHVLAEAWEEGSRAGWSDRTRSLMERRTYEEEVAKATPNPYGSQS